MNTKELYKAIEERALEELRGPRVVQKDWLVQAILHEHEKPTGPDDDFYLACSLHAVSDIVARVIRHDKDSKDTPEEQMTLPGYQHLQRRYSIEREGSQCSVPIHEMTAREVRAKARELRSMAGGLLAHADELDRWADDMVEAAE